MAGLELHHPDPWPKQDQAHNRLMDAGFLKLMSSLLCSGAEWRTKTDFEPHLTRLVQLLPDFPFEILGRRRDLKGEGAPWPEDILTNYQRKSYEDNVPVQAIWLRRR